MKIVLYSLSLLTLLGAAVPAAVAQAPWAAVTPPWDTQTFNTQNVTMMALYGASNIRLLVEGRTTTSGTSYSVVYTSTNEGLIWSSNSLARHQPGSTGTELLDYAPLDEANAWAVIASYNNPSSTQTRTSVDLLKTTTGVAGFTAVPNPAGMNLQFVRGFSATTAVARVANASGFLRTTDGGQNWVPVAPTLATVGQTLQRTTTLGSHLWIPTTAGDVLYTADQGQTWATAATGLGANLRGVAFRDAQHGLAYGGTQFARTTDGGQTWEPVVFSGPARTTYLVALPGTSAGYISVGAGFSSCISGSTAGTAVSTDDGSTWTTVESTDSHSIVAASSPTRVWTNKQDKLAPICAPHQLSRYAGLPLAAKIPTVKLVELYPNPTTGPVQLPAAGAYRQATVFDALGRQRRTLALATTATTLSLADLGAGVYMVVLTGPATRQATRISVMP
ncbi:T9SS type A sorting domain-containing protein [Hymenobacter sp. BT635]|uniref:T9SS type A sorting domain-containing protein n=1 Tax=Hymenobacter nitidus TaxID=2880929 RepID=A0ABS8AGP7_9BACT|nr:T9SS type A sorting domain-containing protein [Hymenobacter nitidus]MCB2379259.1 T9SS type A sorting domain-containing protein [Hymenobacter nitidus]